MAYPTEEQLAALTDKLEKGIQQLYESGRYAEYLRAMSKFHNYSFGNALLILLQCPHASRVAGYTTWKKDFGRHVKRNESGIQILAPCPTRRYVWTEVKDPLTGAILRNPDGTPKKETQLITVTKFKIATVFDISQTEGRELPTLGVSRLTGDVENFAAIYGKLTEISPVPVEVAPCPGEANRYFSATENRIVLRPNLSQIQTVKTLVHEITHAKLHDARTIPPEERKGRSEKEVEAESVAYVVCQQLGIDTAEYSFGYVAGWSKGKELEELKSSLNRIHTAAGEILAGLESSPPARQKTKAAQQHQRYGVAKLDGIMDEVIRYQLGKIRMSSEYDVIAEQHEKAVELARAKLRMTEIQLSEKARELEDYQAETIRVIRGESKLSGELLNELIQKAKSEITALSNAVEQAKQELTEKINSVKFEKQEYDKLQSWADLYDNCTFAAKKMIVSQFIKSVYVYRDYTIEVEFNVSFEQFRSLSANCTNDGNERSTVYPVET